MIYGPLDLIPLWGIFLLLAGGGLLSVELGYRAGQWRRVHVPDEKDGPVAAMVASIVGLLAFMLAFTFGLAAARFDARRQAVIAEANAIGTAFLRSRLLAEPGQNEAADLLTRYAEIRVQNLTEEKMAGLLAESEEIHQKLWKLAVAAANEDPRSIMTGLFVESLNEVIDIHSRRIFVAMHSRIPLTIWLTLFVLTVLGLVSIGYQSGLSATCRSPEMPILTLAFACVMFLIVDLDSGHRGLLTVGQQSMSEVLRTLRASR